VNPLLILLLTGAGAGAVLARKGRQISLARAKVASSQTLALAQPQSEVLVAQTPGDVETFYYDDTAWDWDPGALRTPGWSSGWYARRGGGRGHHGGHRGGRR
jgi:hypothetical protein